jgi:hypothetical protein
VEERLLCKQEVAGSSPAGSIWLLCCKGACFAELRKERHGQHEAVWKRIWKAEERQSLRCDESGARATRGAVRALTVLVALVLLTGVAPAVAHAQGGDRDCADFGSQASAQAFFEANGGPASDPHGLDADHDGIACESNPCPCSTGGEPEPTTPPPTTPTPTTPPPPPRPGGGWRLKVERDSKGPVLAELSYATKRVRAGSFVFIRYSRFRVRIFREGQLVYDRAVGGPCRVACEPSESALTGRVFRLSDLDGDGEPEVVVGLFTGGASCCSWVIAYGFDVEENTYLRDALDAGSGYTRRDYNSDGAVELVGGDYRFKYKFACGACSLQPLRIWQYYSTAGFYEATGDFPGRVRSHARRMLRLYQHTRRSRSADVVKGPLVAYLADTCLLDRCRTGLLVMERARRRGELDRQARYDSGPFGKAFVRKVKRFLRRTGYMGAR